MTEITRVPIKPVGSGSLVKLWLGVLLAVLLGGGLAWAAMPKGLSVETLTEGEGDMVKVGDTAFVKYVGTLAADGEEFDRSAPIPWPIPGVMPDGNPFEVVEGATVPGFFQGLQKMRIGGKYELYIPADLAYGDSPPPGIPVDADLVFEMEVIDTMPTEQFKRLEQAQMAAFQQRQQQMQQLQQQQMGAPPGGPQGAIPQVPPPVPGN